jgi:hypothetical protein
MNLRNLFLPFWAIVVAAGLVCCDKTPQYAIPDVYTDFTLRLDLPEYAALQNIGGWVYISTDQAQVPVGYRGIWLHRTGLQEYRAFDRACSYLPTEACHIVSVDSVSNILLGCGCCTSKYDFGGAPVNPPAPLPLKSYQTYYTPTNNQLRVANN